MGTASLHFDVWGLAWHDLLQRIAPACGRLDCRHTQSVWQRYRRKSRGIVIQGLRYCVEECMERALRDAVERMRPVSARVLAPHRVPLGLVLLSRQQLTAEQLRAALAAQRAAGRGRIGEWLQALGFSSEQQVTAALARQWSCPLLRANSGPAGISWPPGFSKSESSKSRSSRAPQIPLTLLESFVMIPLDYVAATATLHLAFGEGIDYSVLYAIEQMLGCHTEFCLAVPSLVRQRLAALAGPRAESEVVFDRAADEAEFSRIIRSYAIRLSASEIRLAACGPHLWVRLLRPSHPPLDLLLGSSREASKRDSSHLAGLPRSPSALSSLSTASL